ncbi:T9SS type B sorting domain-containing protein [Arsenicibacter rosenii]|uniref:T9SS type B sorting domain-containing protein n=1 Tax=Arsenicibacter rosenii TaxID=1750698 RepID=UPI0015A6300F|nr:T9SS type B sorting domain-containing protein [Arsenicibacter rosenii]
MKQLEPSNFKYLVQVRIYVDISRLSYVDKDYLEIGNHDMRVFRKKNDQSVSYFYLSFSSYSDVVYAKSGCADKLGLSIRAYTYNAVVTLNPTDYEDPEGYYMIWDRCCRNKGITNITSSELANMLIQTELPRLAVNGQPVPFSLPEFPVFPGKIACVGKSFSFNFQATDPDGDQLSYRLVEPLRGLTTINNPIGFPQPGPFQTLAYAAGYSITNLIPGKDPLTINPNTGIISVTPDRIGSYAFTVICEKYRNGKKIGSVVHEFQIPVTECSYNTDSLPVIYHNGIPVQKLTLCPNDSIYLTTDLTKGWSLQWQHDQKSILNETKTGIWVSEAGSFTVKKESSSGCVNDTISMPVIVDVPVQTNSTKIIASSNSLCKGDSVVLTTTLSTSFTPVWYLDNKLMSNNSSLTATKPGTYHLYMIMTNSSCKFLGDSIYIKQRPSPELPLSAAYVICPDDSVKLYVQNQNGWTYQWSYNNLIVGSNSSITVRDSGNYFMKVINEFGCKAISLPYKISYRSDCLQNNLYIPSAFTPNGDGINDVWEIKSMTQYPQLVIRVFNRWGECIFLSSTSKPFWDGQYNGQPIESGTFVYQIQIAPGKTPLRGSVTLIR